MFVCVFYGISIVMECTLRKRLLKSTFPNQESIGAELQVCKVILSSQKSKASQACHNNKALQEKLMTLEWLYVVQLSKKKKLEAQYKKISKQIQEHPRMQEEIAKLRKEIIEVNGKSELVRQKIMDRYQRLTEDEKYLEKLNSQNMKLKGQVSRILASNQAMEKKKQKLEFVMKENQQIFSQEKIIIRQKLNQKVKVLRKTLRQTKNNFQNQYQNLQKVEREQRNQKNKVESLEQKFQIATQKEKAEKYLVNKLQRDIFQQSNHKFELTQRLKIQKQKLEALKLRKQALKSGKANLQSATIKFLQIRQQILQQLVQVEQTSSFQIQHIFRILALNH